MANLVNTLGGTAGFGEFRLPRSDDASSTFIDLTPVFGTGGINFYGHTYTGLYINNNGSVTFVRALPTFTPDVIGGSTGNPIIAPFWADVDTRGGVLIPQPHERLVGESGDPAEGNSTGSNTVWYDLDPGSRTLTVTWDDVGFFNRLGFEVNAFQLSLTKVNEAGDFDIVFRYEQIDWTTGGLSGGDAKGQGGRAAQAGYSAGDGFHFYELPASGDPAALLDLSESSNVGIPGLYRFNIRAGVGLSTLSVGDTDISEGAPGVGVVAVPVYLSGPSSERVTVRYRTVEGTATAGLDFSPQAGLLTFLPGMTEQTIYIPIKDDDLVELDEGFLIELSEATGAAIGFSTGRVTLISDDGFAVNSVRQLEGSGDKGSTFEFTVTLLKPALEPVTVNYRTVPGSATPDVDYVDAFGTLTFAPGDVSKTVTVDITPDALSEDDETFLFELFNTENTEKELVRATATIVNDDGLVIDDLDLIEGSIGSTSAAVRVRLLSPQTTPVTVSWTAAPGTARTGLDFVPIGGTLTFNPGETSKTLSVPVTADGIVEATEQFRVLLGNAVGAAIVDGSADIAIVDDDGLAVSDPVLVEGDAGTSAMVFTVTLGSALAAPVGVDVATVGGTATGGLDYRHVSTRLVFLPGETSKTVSVPVVGDTAVEGLETVRLVLLNPTSNADLADAEGIGTIVDDDGLAVVGLDAMERDGTGGRVEFAVTLNRPRTEPVTVRYTTADGTARAGVDYLPNAGVLTFAPGETRKVVPVSLVGDLSFEGPETLRLLLSDATGARISTASGTARIVNDDLLSLPTISITGTGMTEGTDESNPVMRFTVVLSRAVDQDVIAEFRTLSDSAVAGVDFVPVTGSVLIPAGKTRGVIEVPVMADALSEPDETFIVLLPTPPAGTILGSASAATGTIFNDDLGPLSRLSTARVFLGSDDRYTALVPGQSVFGSAGIESVAVAPGATQVTINQTIERVSLPGRPADYLFLQNGNRLTVFDPTGLVPLTTVTVQRDLDGTVIAFTNGQTNARMLPNGKMVLGESGVVVGASSPIRLDPFLAPLPPVSDLPPDVSVFLGAGDPWTVGDRGVSVVGSTGVESVTLLTGVSGAALSDTVEALQLPLASQDYTFMQDQGRLLVYAADAQTLVVSVAVQRDGDGTELRFGPQEVYAVRLSADGQMRIDDELVSPVEPTSLSLLADDALQSTIVVDGPFTRIESVATDTRFVLPPSLQSSYTVHIIGFGAGDQIVSPLDLQPSVINEDFDDGLVVLQYAAAGHVVEIRLTGLPIGVDAALLDPASFNSVFGPGTFT